MLRILYFKLFSYITNCCDQYVYFIDKIEVERDWEIC